MKKVIFIIVLVLVTFGTLPMANSTEPGNIRVLERHLVVHNIKVQADRMFEQRILTTVMCIDGSAWMTQESMDSRGGRTTAPLTRIGPSGQVVPTKCEEYGVAKPTE